MIMRQLRIRELPAARDNLGNTFIIALIVGALFWGYQLRQRVDGRDYLIRTIAFEASGETEVGKVAVAYVVLNRKKSGKWGDNIKAVVTSPDQFEPWMTRRREIEGLSPNVPHYQSAAIIADTGCLTCNLWSTPSGKRWKRLSEEDLRALHLLVRT